MRQRGIRPPRTGQREIQDRAQRSQSTGRPVAIHLSLHLPVFLPHLVFLFLFISAGLSCESGVCRRIAHIALHCGRADLLRGSVGRRALRSRSYSPRRRPHHRPAGYHRPVHRALRGGLRNIHTKVRRGTFKHVHTYIHTYMHTFYTYTCIHT